MGQFILWWLLSVGGRDYVVDVASSTSGLYTLSISKVGNLPVPIPPLVEQGAVTAEVDSRITLVREVEAQTDANLTRAERMRQSILTHAFSGKLTRCDLELGGDTQPAGMQAKCANFRLSREN